MNCQSIEETVNELARQRALDDTIEEHLREGVRAHLDECSACALRLQDGRALMHRLDELAREMNSVTAPASVEEKLQTAFREMCGERALAPVRIVDRERSGVRDQRSEIKSRWRRWSLPIAAAAVLLIVLGLAGLRWRTSGPLQPESGQGETAGVQTSSGKSLSTVAAAINGFSSKLKDSFTANGRPRDRYRRIPYSRNRSRNKGSQANTENTAAIANDTESEVATQFMPLGYAGPINLQDGGQLVRVEMSRAAMLNLGLPVNMDRYSERVKADVLLGADGLARAIRFVQ